MTTISMKVPESLAKELAAEARRRGASKSALLRLALSHLLEDGPRRRTKTFGELAGDLIGSLEGPGDLSYNKDHMKDFGR
jgi:hypothetical protein